MAGLEVSPTAGTALHVYLSLEGLAKPDGVLDTKCSVSSFERRQSNGVGEKDYLNSESVLSVYPLDVFSLSSDYFANMRIRYPFAGRHPYICGF